MFQASKLILFSSLAMPLLINNERVIEVSSLEVIEQNDGIVLKGNYHCIKKVFSSAYLIFNMEVNGIKNEVKKKFLMEMSVDGEFNSDVIAYSSMPSIATFTFTIEPNNTKYDKDTQSIKYNPSQNASKYLNMSEVNNNIPIPTNYYKENFNIDASKIKKYYQAFTTLNYEDNRVNDVYKYFDISFLNFKYINGNDNELKGECTFSFYDSYDLFKNFPAREGTMFKSIPLSLNKDNETYHCTFKNKLYYEPNTRLVSYTPIEGYIETNYLYFPIGYENKLKDIRCQLSFNIEDEFSFNVSGEFKISYIKKYFGDCSDSEYCITSQDDVNENVYETVVDITL